MVHKTTFNLNVLANRNTFPLMIIHIYCRITLHINLIYNSIFCESNFIAEHHKASTISIFLIKTQSLDTAHLQAFGLLPTQFLGISLALLYK